MAGIRAGDVEPMRDEDWFVCPHCGEVLVGDPSSCSRCGADDETGWSGSTLYDGVELDGDFDYEDYLADEFGPDTGHAHRSRWVLLVIAGMIVALVALLVLR